jgi:hypothetical protein
MKFSATTAGLTDDVGVQKLVFALDAEAPSVVPEIDISDVGNGISHRYSLRAACKRA